MVCLSEKYGDSLCHADGWLFIHRAARSDVRYRTYLFPLGDGNLREAADLLTEDAAAHRAKVRFETLTEHQAEELNRLYPGRFRTAEDRDMSEYIYRKDRIAELSGHGAVTKRYESRTFRKNYAGRAAVSMITPADLAEIRAFQEKWLESKRTDASWVNLKHENQSIEIALNHYEALGLEGLVLRIDGKVYGYVYGCRLSGNCLDMAVEKADRNLLGIYSFLNQEFAIKCGEGCIYLNWEEDVGVPGLRQAKLSYKPDILLKKYILSEV